ncbi:hypothetical protein [Stutzerimonas stutzeri]|uniref:hypothetical protein n=1 Tax=Stutzerimonas stutzeri TaxID=316 RepID=UPI003EB87E44
MINFSNSLQILNIFALSTVLLVIWSLPTQADLQATNSRVSQIEDRVTNHLSYNEGRTNALDARVTERLNKIDRRVQMLEVKAGR